MLANNKTVLVLGEDSRSFLSVIRSLGRAGYCIHVVCYDRDSISLKSKYISDAFFYNYQSYNPVQWQRNVFALIERYQYDVVFPCDERAIYPLYALKDKLPAHTRLAIVNSNALMLLFDKWKTKQLAKRCQVPVAHGKLIKLGRCSFPELSEHFALPFVLKPLHSFTEDSLTLRHKVAIIHNQQEFDDFCAQNSNEADYLAEQFFTGNGEGVAIFAWQGEVRAAFAYTRLAEPYSGGGSSYRESRDMDLSQLDACQKMASACQLCGLAMFEFRRSPCQTQWILVEINARAWGGMPLAEYAGVDFARLYCDALCADSAPSRVANPHDPNQHSPKQLPLDYPKVRARALLADLYEIRRESECKALKFNAFAGRLHTVKRLGKIVSVVSNKESIDSLRADDIRPFIGELTLIAHELFLPSASRMRLVVWYRRKLMQKKLKASLAKPIHRRVIFICYGNIIRSPFAEHYYQQRLTGLKRAFKTESFGFHKNELRSSPDIAQIAASDFYCNLHSHRSRSLSQLDLIETDILFYFDDKNKQLLRRYYQVNHAYSLSDFLTHQYPGLSEIADPYETDVATIKGCYQKISNAIDNLITIHQEAWK